MDPKKLSPENPSPAGQQGGSGTGGVDMESDKVESFDVSRAVLLDKPRFKPFYPQRFQALGAALKRGEVRGDQRLLVAEIGSQVLALDLHQMGYHHVAQGELAGEPWLVTF